MKILARGPLVTQWPQLPGSWWSGLPLPPGVGSPSWHLRAYAGAAPITCSSATSHTVAHRKVCNRSLKTAAHHWAFASMRASPGCGALYAPAHGDGYSAALRRCWGRRSPSRDLFEAPSLGGELLSLQQ
ncbi:transposase [Streptomyces sp. NPDC059247]|uniref:transposase n=1 Tax=Streptomyces sp. NPDC059247 TaxID=3346790 RepID=UPI00367FCD12